MTGNFNWQTEEDGEWEGAEPSGKMPRRRRRWLWPLAALAAIILAGVVVFWQVREQISSAEASRADDIVSSFYLIRQAVEDDDRELFRNLLSGSDLEWAMAQQELFSAGWLFDLSAFGLAKRPIRLEQAEVTLSPRFDSGEVVALAPYALAGRGTVSETIVLQQTSVFRQGERWVWSPPRDEFWGEDSTLDGRFLVIDYPERDEAIARRLHKDMDTLVAQMCESVDELACPADLKIRLILSREPAALFDLTERFVSQGYFGTRAGGRLNGSGHYEIPMPAPSLLGIPLDEAGYQALLRGYATHLAVGLTNRLVDPECCATESRYRAAVQVMLRDFGLQEWAFTVGDLTGPQEVQAPLEQVALLCSDGFERRQQMFLLDLAAGNWQEQPMGLDQIAIKALPSEKGVLLLGQQADGDRFRSQVWRRSPEGDTLLFDMPVSRAEAGQVSWEIRERQGRLVIEIANVRRGFSRYFTIDLAQCRLGDCPPDPESTVSRPVWSPDGSQLMVHAYGLLWWRQGASMVQIANGTAPFWVDEDTYGYAKSVGREQAVVLVNASERQSETVVFTTDDLRYALDPEAQPARLLIGRVLVTPGELPGEDPVSGGKWLILAFEVGREGAVNQARFFTFDLVTGQVSLVPHTGRLLSYNRPASGRRLAIGGFDDQDGRWAMTVSDQDLAEPITLILAAAGSAGSVPSYSWSANEQWLLILEQGLLTLLHPSTGAVQRIVPPEPGCVQAAWYGAAGDIEGGEGAGNNSP